MTQNNMIICQVSLWEQKRTNTKYFPTNHINQIVLQHPHGLYDTRIHACLESPPKEKQDSLVFFRGLKKSYYSIPILNPVALANGKCVNAINQTDTSGKKTHKNTPKCPRILCNSLKAYKCTSQTKNIQMFPTAAARQYLCQEDKFCVCPQDTTGNVFHER